MSVNHEIAVIGGDKRQLYMCKLLALKGFQVLCLKVESDGEEIDHITYVDTLKQVMEQCSIIIGPIPFSRDHIHVYSNLDSNIELDEFISLITKKHTIIGGNISKNIIKTVKAQQANYFDFMESDEIAVKNAVATAEGAILEAIKSSNINLSESKSLVLGFGRCAKVLADKLKALDVNVTIGARNEEQRNLAKKQGFQVISLENISNYLFEYDFIFNSIPAMILTATCLSECKKEVVIIDIASKPGGTDFEECKTLGINAVLALGLPGKYSPKTSAEILVQAIEHLLPHK